MEWPKQGYQVLNYTKDTESKIFQSETKAREELKNIKLSNPFDRIKLKIYTEHGYKIEL